MFIITHRVAEKVSALLKDPPKSTDERWDLRSLPAFTIDDPATTDVDDAVSFARAADGTEWVRMPVHGGYYICSETLTLRRQIYIHVADPSRFILPQSDLDTLARARSTSVRSLSSVVR